MQTKNICIEINLEKVYTVENGSYSVIPFNNYISLIQNFTIVHK